jgi:hypothetical protein
LSDFTLNHDDIYGNFNFSQNPHSSFTATFYFPELQGVFQHKTSQNSLVISASERKSRDDEDLSCSHLKTTLLFILFATPHFDWALYLFVL